jgi:hypothetical protein
MTGVTLSHDLSYGMTDDEAVERIYKSIMSIWWSGAPAKVTMVGLERANLDTKEYFEAIEASARYHAEHIWHDLKLQLGNVQVCDNLYYCPASREVECPQHGGFSVCCDAQDKHVTLGGYKCLDHDPV